MDELWACDGHCVDGSSPDILTGLATLCMSRAYEVRLYGPVLGCSSVVYHGKEK